MSLNVSFFFFITAQVTKVHEEILCTEDDGVVCLWNMYSLIVCYLPLPDSEWVLLNPEWATIVPCVCRALNKEHSFKWWLCPFCVLEQKSHVQIQKTFKDLFIYLKTYCHYKYQRETFLYRGFFMWTSIKGNTLFFCQKSYFINHLFRWWYMYLFFFQCTFCFTM